MIEVIPGLYVGSQNDYDAAKANTKMKVISAAKEPWHRQALGYTGRGAPKEDPEYLVAYRPRHVILNLVDPNDAKWIPREVIDAAIDEIGGGLDDGLDVLVHCNQGESRAPSIALLYLLTDSLTNGPFLDCENGDEVIDVFRTDYYPDYNPSEGFTQFVRDNWASYLTGKE
jgi:hypothetical protein